MAEAISRVPADFRGSQAASDVTERLLSFLDNVIIPMEQSAGLKWGDIPPKDLLQSVWTKSAEAGFYTLLLPAELGGAGLSMHDIVAVKEASIAHGAILGLHVLGELTGPPRIGHLYQSATPFQVEHFLDPVCRAEKAVCFALTEPDSGSDAASISTHAVRDGDSFILNGYKRFISGSPYADFAVVIAVTDPDKGAKGISAFFVDLHSPGCEVKQDYEVLSDQRSHADIDFKDVRVPAANLIGEEGQGFYLGMARITMNRLLHCATMLGYSRIALKESVNYASRRRQFGRSIGEFQAIQHMLAKMNTELYASRSMMFDAAAQSDTGQDIRMEASMCKVHASETCFNVVDSAMQIHGGQGMLKGSVIEYLFRFLRMYRIVTGTSEIQRNTIAKAMLSPGKN
ncbi:MAG: acyl-CoA dehydrogenase family protein [Notoacmeibacter sp.]|nr:acyl-CoA dehydrogenase family protein [Notoacmeibacter sp.]